MPNKWICMYYIHFHDPRGPKTKSKGDTAIGLVPTSVRESTTIVFSLTVVNRTIERSRSVTPNSAKRCCQIGALLPIFRVCQIRGIQRGNETRYTLAECIQPRNWLGYVRPPAITSNYSTNTLSFRHFTRHGSRQGTLRHPLVSVLPAAAAAYRRQCNELC